MKPIEFRVWDKQMKVYDVPTEIHIDDGGHITSVDTYHGTLWEAEMDFNHRGCSTKNYAIKSVKLVED